jgi:hypothetical protein
MVVAQPANVEVLFHRVGGRQEPNCFEPACRTASAVVSPMWTSGTLTASEMVSATLCSVGAEDEEFRAGVSEAAGLVGQTLAGLIPKRVALEVLDLGEVDGAEHAVGGVQPAEPVADLLVDQPVVLG